jgi:hypothetical protein
MDPTRAHQSRFRRKLKHLLPRRLRHAPNNPDSPLIGEVKPLPPNDSNAIQAVEAITVTTTIEAEVEYNEESPETPQSRSASPHRHTTAMEQTLARVQLEKALWEKARRAHPSPSPPCNLLTTA